MLPTFFKNYIRTKRKLFWFYISSNNIFYNFIYHNIPLPSISNNICHAIY